MHNDRSALQFELHGPSVHGKMVRGLLVAFLMYTYLNVSAEKITLVLECSILSGYLGGCAGVITVYLLVAELPMTSKSTCRCRAKYGRSQPL